MNVITFDGVTDFPKSILMVHNCLSLCCSASLFSITLCSVSRTHSSASSGLLFIASSLFFQSHLLHSHFWFFLLFYLCGKDLPDVFFCRAQWVSLWLLLSILHPACDLYILHLDLWPRTYVALSFRMNSNILAFGPSLCLHLCWKSQLCLLLKVMASWRRSHVVPRA